MDTQQNFRPAEAAEYLRISKAQLWKLVKEGLIKTVKLSPQVTIIRRREIERFLDSAVQAGGCDEKPNA
ncbi:helix-turn-helix domain-containing protein [Nitratifractor sp.]|uniref:helix-turn-helix transcriptional regulator n=1 Tax=Nitratifractor sp. TaxID=2268144 RepID=UPI00343A6B4B